jgi:hypothetical protein
MRAFLALLLVCHYLLTGVLGSAWATLAREPAPSAQHPYVHSVLCQTHNYLRLDCFDQCNGDQPGHLLKQLATGDDHPSGAPQNHDKAQCDVHVLTALVAVPTAPRYGLPIRPARLLPIPAVVTAEFPVEGPPPKVASAYLG